MRNLWLLFQLALVLCVVSFITRVAQGQDTTNVSIVQLIAEPQKHDGKVVVAVGYLVIEHEANILYLHKEDYEHGIYKNGLWLVLTAKNKEDLNGLSKHYVVLSGTFNASNKGHMSVASGALENITRALLWPPGSTQKKQ